MYGLLRGAESILGFYHLFGRLVINQPILANFFRFQGALSNKLVDGAVAQAAHLLEFSNADGKRLFFVPCRKLFAQLSLLKTGYA